MSSALADERESGVEAEVFAALQAYGKAIGEKNVDACMAAYAPGLGTIMLGTGPGERWVGDEEIREAHTHILGAFDKESSMSTWKLLRIKDDIAWGASQRAVTSYYKNQKKEFYLNISAVLMKQDGKWRIVLFHYSNVTAPDVQD
jgi:uncharacterized protein (TIGR02246 family)